MLEAIIAQMNGIIAILIYSSLYDIRLDGFMNMKLQTCLKKYLTMIKKIKWFSMLRVHRYKMEVQGGEMAMQRYKLGHRFDKEPKRAIYLLSLHCH